MGCCPFMIIPNLRATSGRFLHTRPLSNSVGSLPASLGDGGPESFPGKSGSKRLSRFFGYATRLERWRWMLSAESPTCTRMHVSSFECSTCQCFEGFCVFSAGLGPKQVASVRLQLSRETEPLQKGSWAAIVKSEHQK